MTAFDDTKKKKSTESKKKRDRRVECGFSDFGRLLSDLQKARDIGMTAAEHSAQGYRCSNDTGSNGHSEKVMEDRVCLFFVRQAVSCVKVTSCTHDARELEGYAAESANTCPSPLQHM